MLPLPKEKTDNLLKAKKSRNQGRRPATSIVKMREVKRNMGINAIKDRVHEVVEMKRLVIGEQPLSGYLIEKVGLLLLSCFFEEYALAVTFISRD